MADCQHCVFSVRFLPFWSSLTSGANRLQRYCFFLDWPNFWVTFFIKFITFFVSGWLSALRFSVWLLPFRGSPTSGANRVQRYCFFLDWPNFKSEKMLKNITFFISSWFSIIAKSITSKGDRTRIHARAYILRYARARVCHKDSLLRVFMGHTWSIRGVFMGYTYVSGMCRVCIGYVSGKCRKIQWARRLRYKISCRYLQVSKKSSTFVGNLGNFELRIRNYPFEIRI